MMTSKAISNVTNMATVKIDRRQHRLPQRDAADQPHEADDQNEARDIKPEPLRDHAEQQGRHENLQYAAKLVARDEGFGSPRFA